MQRTPGSLRLQIGISGKGNSGAPSVPNLPAAILSGLSGEAFLSGKDVPEIVPPHGLRMNPSVRSCEEDSCAWKKENRGFARDGIAVFSACGKAPWKTSAEEDASLEKNGFSFARRLVSFEWPRVHFRML